MSFKIIQGEDRVLTVLLKQSNGEAYDLTGNTEISACFVGTAGNITKTKTATEVAVIGSDDCGKITITLTDTDTALLPDGTMGFTIDVEVGVSKRTVNLANSLIIEERIC